MISISFKLTHEKAKMPSKAHDGDAAFDLYSVEELTLAPGETRAVDTGLQLADTGYGTMATGPSFFLKIEGRSGLALKQIIPTGGIIDASYRGNIKCIMNNFSKQPFAINIGDKIAQLIIYRICATPMEVEISQTETVVETTRGSNGFGSTGTK
jgi:dUTP pyrophosphatase